MAATGIAVNQFDVCFAAALEEIDTVCEKVKELLFEAGLEKFLFEVVLLAREAMVNAVEHGSRMDPQKQVRFHIRLDAGEAVIEVEDEGPGFDWKNGLKKEAEVTQGYGRGLPIFRHYATEIRYNDKGNKIFLQKKLS